jgi:hypothetical protein
MALHLRRMTAAAAAACSLGLADAAAAQTDANAPPVYPGSLSIGDLTAWLKQETDIAPTSVVAVTPTAITAILGSISSSEGPSRRQVILRSEALTAKIFEKDKALSWTSVVAVDCDTRLYRRGRTMAYGARNLMGDARQTVAPDTAWVAPPANGAIYNATLRVCDNKVVNPLLPQTVAAATPSPAPPQAGPAPNPVPGGAAAKPARATAAMGGRGAAQVSASATEAEAKRSLAAAQTLIGELPNGVSGRVTKAVVGRKTYYRALFSGFGSAADAAGFCKALTAKGRPCFVRGGS